MVKYTLAVSIKRRIEPLSHSVLGILGILLEQIPDLTVDLRENISDVWQNHIVTRDDVVRWQRLRLRQRHQVLVLSDNDVVSIVKRIVEVVCRQALKLEVLRMMRLLQE